MRGSRFAPTCALLATAAATAVALLTSRSGDWDKPVVFVLVGTMALIADRYVIRSPTGTIVVATHPVFVLGMVALGPVPMLLIGQAVVFANRPKKVQVLVGNAAVYAVFLVAGSLLARLMRQGLDVPESSAWFAVAVVVLFLATWLLNVVLIAAYLWWLDGVRIDRELTASTWPLISTNLALACATAILVYLVATVGAAVIALSGVILIAYSRLQRDLLQAERHAETARQLAADAQEQRDGLVRIILDFLDARDQMTARHSAAVARYARRIAEAAGCPDAEQRLVHTAALYHDVGKVMFADRMFKAGKLTDEEWEIVKRHPERGAELVGHLPNHEDVAAIILAHHERIDGRGYPRGLAGEDDPAPVADDLDRRHLRRHDRPRLLSPARQLGRGDRGAAPRVGGAARRQPRGDLRRAGASGRGSGLPPRRRRRLRGRARRRTRRPRRVAADRASR